MDARPRQGAFFVSQQLLGRGLSPSEALAEMRSQGFDEAEARIALAAAGGQVSQVEKRWAADEAGRQRGQRGYWRALIGSLLLGGGVLLWLGYGQWVGSVLALAGVPLVAVALFDLLRSEGT